MASENASVRMTEDSPEKRGQAQSDEPSVLGTKGDSEGKICPATDLGSSLNHVMEAESSEKVMYKKKKKSFPKAPLS